MTPKKYYPQNDREEELIFHHRNEGIQEGKKHATSAPDTVTWLKEIEKSQKDSHIQLKKDIAEIIRLTVKPITDIQEKHEKEMLRKIEFNPVKKLVYGFATIFFVTMVGGLATAVTAKVVPHFIGKPEAQVEITDIYHA